MNLDGVGPSDWDILGPSTNLIIDNASDDFGYSLILQILAIPEVGKRRIPEFIPLKDIIVYLRGNLGIPLLPIEVVKMMVSLGIPLYDDFLKVNAIIGVPISPEELARIKQRLAVTIYGFPLEISAPIRVTEQLSDFVGEIWTVKKSKKRLKKIKEKLKSMSTT